jgi:hypothetical protein
LAMEREGQRERRERASAGRHSGEEESPTSGIFSRRRSYFNWKKDSVAMLTSTMTEYHFPILTMYHGKLCNTPSSSILSHFFHVDGMVMG